MSDEPKQEPPSVEAIIAASRAVCEAATPPPWHHGKRSMLFNRVSHNLYDGNDCDITDSAADMAPDDADFCVHARTMLPRCLEALEYAKSALGEMYKELQDAGGGGCDDAHKYHPTAKHAWCPGCHVERMTTILSGKGGDDV